MDRCRVAGTPEPVVHRNPPLGRTGVQKSKNGYPSLRIPAGEMHMFDEIADPMEQCISVGDQPLGKKGLDVQEKIRQKVETTEGRCGAIHAVLHRPNAMSSSTGVRM